MGRTLNMPKNSAHRPIEAEIKAKSERAPLSDYDKIAEAIRFLDGNWKDQPSLESMASHIGLSEFHFQRLFQRWVGVSPKKFLQTLTVEAALQRLQESRSVLNAAWDVGLSGSGRLHDLTVALCAMTPGEIRTQGENLNIKYGTSSTPFGPAFVAATERGIVRLTFLDSGDVTDDATDVVTTELQNLRATYTKAKFQNNEAETKKLLTKVFSPAASTNGPTLRAFVQGTQFQVKVWNALLRIPEGHLSSYRDLARAIGAPGAARAVGSAVGANPIAYLIPCHRVIRETGVLGGYRWGETRKRALLAWETSRTDLGRVEPVLCADKRTR